MSATETVEPPSRYRGLRPRLRAGDVTNPTGTTQRAGASVRQALRTLLGREVIQPGRVRDTYAYRIATRLVRLASDEQAHPRDSNAAAQLVIEQTDGKIPDAALVGGGVIVVQVLAPQLVGGRDPDSLTAAEWSAAARRYVDALSSATPDVDEARRLALEGLPDPSEPVSGG